MTLSFFFASSIWDEPGKSLQPGDIVRLSKCYAALFRGCLTLYSGKNGEISRIGDFCMVSRKLIRSKFMLTEVNFRSLTSSWTWVNRYLPKLLHLLWQWPTTEQMEDPKLLTFLRCQPWILQLVTTCQQIAWNQKEVTTETMFEDQSIKNKLFLNCLKATISSKVCNFIRFLFSTRF